MNPELSPTFHTGIHQTDSTMLIMFGLRSHWALIISRPYLNQRILSSSSLPIGIPSEYIALHSYGLSIASGALSSFMGTLSLVAKFPSASRHRLSDAYPLFWPSDATQPFLSLQLWGSCTLPSIARAFSFGLRSFPSVNYSLRLAEMSCFANVMPTCEVLKVMVSLPAIDQQLGREGDRLRSQWDWQRGGGHHGHWSVKLILVEIGVKRSISQRAAILLFYDTMLKNL